MSEVIGLRSKAVARSAPPPRLRPMSGRYAETWRQQAPKQRHELGRPHMDASAHRHQVEGGALGVLDAGALTKERTRRDSVSRFAASCEALR